MVAAAAAVERIWQTKTPRVKGDPMATMAPLWSGAS